MKNKRSTGTQYEKIAAQHLQQLGFEILETNFYNRFGEIDLIVQKDDLLVAVEVKYRRNPQISIYQSIPQKKINRIVKGLLYYAGTRSNTGECALRVDAILITGSSSGDEVVHLENIQANY